MRLEKGVITNTQLMFLILSFMEFMVMSVNFVYSICGADAWIAVLAAYAVTMLVAVGYTAIAKCCPGKNLVEINDTVFGPYLGKLFSALYLWFFFEYMIHIAYYFNSFWLTYIMATLPPPTTATRLPILTSLPRLTSRRKSTPPQTPASSSPGTFSLVLFCAPMAI